MGMTKKGIVKTLSIFSERRLTTVAGAWVFYFLTSVIPVAFLIITAFGVFGVELSEDLVSRLPIEFRSAGEAIIGTAKRASKGATLLFILTAIFSGSGLLNQMSKDGDFIYCKKSKSNRAAMRRIWAIFALVSLFFVFLIASVIIALGGNLFSINSLGSGIKRLITSIAVFFIIIAFSFVIIIMLNRFISPVKLKFKEVAIGGLCSLFAIVMGTIGFALYLRLFNSYNAFYGSLAGIIVFLLWVYILMIGLVAGVIINAVIKQKADKKQKCLENAVKINKTLDRVF